MIIWKKKIGISNIINSLTVPVGSQHLKFWIALPWDGDLWNKTQKTLNLPKALKSRLKVDRYLISGVPASQKELYQYLAKLTWLARFFFFSGIFVLRYLKMTPAAIFWDSGLESHNFQTVNFSYNWATGKKKKSRIRGWSPDSFVLVLPRLIFKCLFHNIQYIY